MTSSGPRKAPPTVDAEQAVLGSLMLDPKSLALLADWLGEADFHRSEHRAIFRGIAELAGRSQPCDALTLSEWFAENGLSAQTGGMSYVLHLANSTPSVANIVAYGEIVAEQSRKRQAQEIASVLATEARARDVKAGDAIASAMYSLALISSTGVRGGLVPAKVATRRVYQGILERVARSPEILGLATPWRSLNEITKGLRNATLYVVGARPSMGKTVLAANVATFAALCGARVAFFSVEMASDEIIARSIAAQAHIPFAFVEKPYGPDSELYWPRLADATTRLVDAPLHIDDTHAIGIDALMARARREHMRAPLQLIVIDHMHEMAIDPKREVRHEYGRITQGAKTLAKELDCPVVLMAQLNRQVTARADKRPTMADLRESGEIEQKADVILLMHREDYYEPSTNLKGVVEMIPAKGRNIRVDESAFLRNCFDQMRLDDWEGPIPTAVKSSSSGFRRTSHRQTTSEGIAVKTRHSLGHQ